MTGAGFGGCAIALVKKDSFDDFAARLIPYYKERVGYEPEVFASEIGDGARKI
jgi:galactokinase